mmetsp:Transcript_15092/g.44675  ORF Transcript_15092/g.44675 Transcript_15092/m.44675 type:complete len:207 (+) Transcript_15092:382-1002(+)
MIVRLRSNSAARSCCTFAWTSSCTCFREFCSEVMMSDSCVSWISPTTSIIAAGLEINMRYSASSREDSTANADLIAELLRLLALLNCLLPTEGVEDCPATPLWSLVGLGGLLPGTSGPRPPASCCKECAPDAWKPLREGLPSSPSDVGKPSAAAARSCGDGNEGSLATVDDDGPSSGSVDEYLATTEDAKSRSSPWNATSPASARR